MSKQTLTRALWINATIFAAALCYAIAFTLARRMGWHIFDCQWVRTLGVNCPGCGGSRALLALWRLDFGAALYYSPALVYSFFLLLWYDFTTLLAVIKRDDALCRLCPRVLVLVVAIFFLLVFLLRLYRTLVLGMPPI